MDLKLNETDLVITSIEILILSWLHKDFLPHDKTVKTLGILRLTRLSPFGALLTGALLSFQSHVGSTPCFPLTSQVVPLLLEEAP